MMLPTDAAMTTRRSSLGATCGAGMGLPSGRAMSNPAGATQRPGGARLQPVAAERHTKIEREYTRFALSADARSDDPTATQPCRYQRLMQGVTIRGPVSRRPS